MNDFKEIETELGKLRPAPLGSEFVLRIEKELAESSQIASAGVLPKKRSTRAGWISLGLGLGLAAAAAFLILARVDDQHQPAGEPSRVTQATPASVNSAKTRNSRLLPTGLTEVVYHTRDEGLHFSENASQPVRRIRYQASETLRWHNPDTGASLRVSYPTEEVVLVPVPGQ